MISPQIKPPSSVPAQGICGEKGLGEWARRSRGGTHPSSVLGRAAESKREADGQEPCGDALLSSAELLTALSAPVAQQMKFSTGTKHVAGPFRPFAWRLGPT